jgi:archaemetzincin
VKTIRLVPLGNTDPSLIERLCTELMRALGASVTIRPAPGPWDDFLDEARGQYNSTQILLHLKNNHTFPHARDEKLLAVVGDDLFIPILTFVFGEAELGGNVAVASYHRLQNERYGLPGNDALLLNRFVKECLHELGHTYGLIHCMEQDCVMHASTDVEEVDLKGASFCSACSKSLR